MENRNLLVEKENGVVLVTINRPKALNSLNSAVLDELLQAFTDLAADRGAKAIVLTGSGDKAFVAGADIAEMAAMNSPQALAFSRRGQALVNLIGTMAKPVIAAVNGFALGGGLELALACDFIYAADTAKMGLPEVTLGVLPGFGGTQKLSRIVGRSRANELILTGTMFTAGEAREWGVVNAIFPRGELVAQARAAATKIAANAPLGVAHAKDAIRSGLDMGETDGMNYESLHFGALFATGDQKEGMGAFLEKRKAVFTGN
jgi:enoyl-CoA hydratase